MKYLMQKIRYGFFFGGVYNSLKEVHCSCEINIVAEVVTNGFSSTKNVYDVWGSELWS